MSNQDSSNNCYFDVSQKKTSSNNNSKGERAKRLNDLLSSDVRRQIAEEVFGLHSKNKIPRHNLAATTLETFSYPIECKRSFGRLFDIGVSSYCSSVTTALGDFLFTAPNLIIISIGRCELVDPARRCRESTDN